jgi:hypothetical protein
MSGQVALDYQWALVALQPVKSFISKYVRTAMVIRAKAH